MANFAQFVKERLYLKNVSPRTVEWYWESFKCLSNENPAQEELNNLIVSMRQRGLQATSCNNRARAINAYCTGQSIPTGNAAQAASIPTSRS